MREGKNRGTMPRWGKTTRYRLADLPAVFFPGGFCDQPPESQRLAFCFPSHCSAHLKLLYPKVALFSHFELEFWTL